jgi:putative RecB family exonuclease
VFYGTVIHQVLDRVHAHYQGSIDPSTKGTLPGNEDIKRYFVDVAQSLRTQGIRGGRTAVDEQAIRLLQQFNTVEGPHLYPRVVDSEYRMQSDEGDYILRGTVDLLVSENDSNRGPANLEIWDYKGTRRPTEDDDRYRDYLFQMMVYADLYQKRHGVYPARAQLYFLNEFFYQHERGASIDVARKNALLTVQFADHEVQMAREEFRSTVKEIEECRIKDSWESPAVGRGPGEETCSACDFRWNCATVRKDTKLSAKLPLRYP